jgi:nucleotide-binding universal stress UspA family protein
MIAKQAEGFEDRRRPEEALLFRMGPRPPKPAPPADGRLLACLDGGPECGIILDQALAVAKALDLSVTAARVLETTRHPGAPADPLEWQAWRRLGEDCLDRLVSGSAPDASKIERVMLSGPAAGELTGWATEHNVTLMALGTRTGRLERHGLGGTAQKLMEAAASSLLLVPARCTGRPPYRRILVPLDGSSRAESVLPLAARLARAHGAELVLAHVVPKAQGIGGGPLETPTRDLCLRLAEQNEQGARVYLDALKAQLWRERLLVRTIVVRNGDPRSELLQIAREQSADLIIVASHGASGMSDVPCGSVTEYLATHAPSPLLVVRPDFAHVFNMSDAPAQEPVYSTSPQPA